MVLFLVLIVGCNFVLNIIVVEILFEIVDKFEKVIDLNVEI